jgi:predicted nucleic acid-binding protein
MTGSDKIFLDSSCFIYLVENHPKYYVTVGNFISNARENDCVLFTSVITTAEVLVKPKKDENEALIKDFLDTLNALNFVVLNIDFTIAKLSATLRAKYSFLKGLDSLQIASALSFGGTKFLTNDRQLSRITEIEIILIEELIL